MRRKLLSVGSRQVSNYCPNFTTRFLTKQIIDKFSNWTRYKEDYFSTFGASSKASDKFHFKLISN